MMIRSRPAAALRRRALVRSSITEMPGVSSISMGSSMSPAAAPGSRSPSRMRTRSIEACTAMSRWAGREDEQVAALQAVGGDIGLGVAGGHPDDVLRVIHPERDGLVRLVERFADVPEGRAGALLQKREDALLGPIERKVEIGRLLVRERGDVLRGAEQPTQQRAIRHGLPIALDVDAGRDRFLQL